MTNEHDYDRDREHEHGDEQERYSPHDPQDPQDSQGSHDADGDGQPPDGAGLEMGPLDLAPTGQLIAELFRRVGPCVVAYVREPTPDNMSCMGVHISSCSPSSLLVMRGLTAEVEGYVDRVMESQTNQYGSRGWDWEPPSMGCG